MVNIKKPVGQKKWWVRDYDMDEGDIKISVVLKEKGHNVLERTYEECRFTTHQTGENN